MSGLYGVWKNGTCVYVATDFAEAVRFAGDGGCIPWGTVVNWYTDES